MGCKEECRGELRRGERGMRETREGVRAMGGGDGDGEVVGGAGGRAGQGGREGGFGIEVVEEGVGSIEEGCGELCGGCGLLSMQVSGC